MSLPSGSRLRSPRLQWLESNRTKEVCIQLSRISYITVHHIKFMADNIVGRLTAPATNDAQM